MVQQKLDNPIVVPRMLSFLTYQRWEAHVQGLDAFPKENWPDNIPLLYYAYHIMVGLGTFFIAIFCGAALLLWRGALYTTRWMLWILMMSVPFPYIANTAGWITAEVGRQPWLIYGVMRNPGYSRTCRRGTAASLSASWAADSRHPLPSDPAGADHGPTGDVPATPPTRARGADGTWKRLVLVAFMLAAYVVFGIRSNAGIVHLAVARTSEERRTVRHDRAGLGQERSLARRGRHSVFRFPALYAADSAASTYHS